MSSKLRLATLVVGLVTVASACGGSSSPAPATQAPATQAPASQAAPSAAPSAAGTPVPTLPPVVLPSMVPPSGTLDYKGEITFWNTQRDFELAVTQKVIDQWTAAYPDITVKMDPVPFAGADVKYDQAAQAQNAPDLFRSDVGWVSGFADQGYLLDLTSLVTDQADFLTAPFASVQYQGKVWGMPSVTDALGLQCNKQLLTKAGLADAPKTWDELAAAGVKVTDIAAKKYGFYMRGDSYWVQPFTWGWGGTLFTVNDQGQVSSIDINQPPSVDGWTYLKTKLLGVVAPAAPWDYTNDYTNMTEGFKAGTIMCILQGPWQVADILKGTAFTDPTNLSITPVPDGLPGKTGSPVGGHDFVVYAPVGKDASKQAAVMSLLNYIDNTQAQVVNAQLLGLLPTRNSAYADPTVKANPIIQEWQAVMAKATNRAGVPGAQNIYVSYTKGYQNFLNDTGSDVAAAAKTNLDAIAKDWQDVVFKDVMAP